MNGKATDANLKRITGAHYSGREPSKVEADYVYRKLADLIRRILGKDDVPPAAAA